MTAPTFLVISQVYVPDPASVGQHLADAAAEMVRRGHRVKVYTSARGYDDPSIRYPARETLAGVEIHRLPLSSMGKSSLGIRVLAQWIFLAQAFLRAAFTPRLSGILVSTSPPFAGYVGVILGRLRGVPVTYWLMDLNPDQVIVLGRMKATSIAARVVDHMQKAAAWHAARVIVLDRFMADRVLRKFPGGRAEILARKMTVMPPWPHEDALEDVPHDRNPFRKEHGLEGRFVVMFSGNHGLSNPLATILEAALRLEHEGKDPRVVFLFVGGGVGKKEVDQLIATRKPSNVRSLPYQPLESLRYSLSAADVHLVSVGNEVVGVVHPCKIYGAMAVNRPILLMGPDPCHASDIIRDHGAGWHVAHGDVDGAVATLRAMAAAKPEELAAMGCRARSFIDARMTKRALCGAFCDLIEQTMSARRPH